MDMRIIKMGGTVVYKELSEPIFLSTLNDKSLIVVSAIGRYPFLLSSEYRFSIPVNSPAYSGFPVV